MVPERNINGWGRLWGLMILPFSIKSEEGVNKMFWFGDLVDVDIALGDDCVSALF